MINLKNNKVGRFITFEGGEGGGKSTQARLLQYTLKSIGVKSILTREPGGSVGAEEIRELIVSGSSDRWDSLTELCLLYAARRDHWLKLIKPKLEQGIWVISDRFADSSIVYQGYAGDIELDNFAADKPILTERHVPASVLMSKNEEQALSRLVSSALGPAQAQEDDTEASLTPAAVVESKADRPA